MGIAEVTVDPTATSPARSTVFVLASAGVLAGAVLVELALTNESVDQPALRAALACWVTVPYIIAGLIAWRRRPASRLGVLMVAAGYATFLNFLIWSDNNLVFTVGQVTQFLPPVMFLHVFLAFPSGRLESRPDRFVVVGSYVFAALSLPRLALGEYGPRNVLAIADRPGAVTVLQELQLAIVSTLLLAGIAILIRRRRRTGRPLRTSLGVLVDSFSLALLMMAVLFTAGLLQLSSPVLEPIRLVTFAVVGMAPIVFLAGVLQARLGRGSVAELLAELGVNPGPSELQDAVGRALRDPSVTLAYWLPEFGAFADVEGSSFDIEPLNGRSATPVIRDGARVAMLLHDRGLDDEPRLLSSVVAAIGMAIQNAQLQVELRARLQELRGSRVRILEGEQRGRRRLERDLHDGAQQRLIALSLELADLGDRLAPYPELLTRVNSAKEEVAASIAELRDLARGIYPAVVSDHGLAVALESLVTRASVPVQLLGVPEDRLPKPVEMAVYFLVSETLANIAKHARASSAIVEFKRGVENLVVEVRDDGVGGATTENGSGLRGLADRVESLGGRLQIWTPAGRGTRIRAEIPCG